MAELSKQHWSAQRYAETAHFVPAFGAPVVELLAPKAGERILDLGCGDGVLTEKIAAVGASVVAVDAAPDMVAAARARGLDARVCAGQNLDFDREFDAVFSNAALHWMRPQEPVLAGVRRALKPGGRFVAEMGGHNNTAAIMIAFRAVLARYGVDSLKQMPWYFPSAAAYRAKLEAAGFRVEEIAIVPRPTPLEAGLKRWMETFCEDFGRSTRSAPSSNRSCATRPGCGSPTTCGSASTRYCPPCNGAALDRLLHGICAATGNSEHLR
jgi:trans-aconitate methyltransferase